MSYKRVASSRQTLPTAKPNNEKDPSLDSTLARLANEIDMDCPASLLTGNLGSTPTDFAPSNSARTHNTSPQIEKRKEQLTIYEQTITTYQQLINQRRAKLQNQQSKLNKIIYNYAARKSQFDMESSQISTRELSFKNSQHTTRLSTQTEEVLHRESLDIETIKAKLIQKRINLNKAAEIIYLNIAQQFKDAWEIDKDQDEINQMVLILSRIRKKL